MTFAWRRIARLSMSGLVVWTVLYFFLFRKATPPMAWWAAILGGFTVALATGAASAWLMPIEKTAR